MKKNVSKVEYFEVSEQYKKVLKFVQESGDRAYKMWDGADILEEKDGGADLSTNFDGEIEKSFYDLVVSEFPEYGFVGEEFPELRKDGEFIWQIDPIDGTRYFANGIPFWSVTCALTKGNEPIFGCIYNAVSKQMYYAEAGKGAYLNGKQIFLNPQTDLSKLQISIDKSKLEFNGKDFNDDAVAIFTKLVRKSYRLRMLGNGALSLAWLAQGFFGAFVDLLRPEEKFVDIAAGLILAKEAGAVVKRIDLGDGVTRNIVGREEVVEEILELIR